MIQSEGKSKQVTKFLLVLALKTALIFVKNEQVKVIIRELLDNLDEILDIINLNK